MFIYSVLPYQHDLRILRIAVTSTYYASTCLLSYLCFGLISHLSFVLFMRTIAFLLVSSSSLPCLYSFSFRQPILSQWQYNDSMSCHSQSCAYWLTALRSWEKQNTRIVSRVAEQVSALAIGITRNGAALMLQTRARQVLGSNLDRLVRDTAYYNYFSWSTSAFRRKSQGSTSGRDSFPPKFFIRETRRGSGHCPGIACRDWGKLR
jgi:hypothetical protein